VTAAALLLLLLDAANDADDLGSYDIGFFFI
jgi:hypothetical protein